MKESRFAAHPATGSTRCWVGRRAAAVLFLALAVAFAAPLRAAAPEWRMLLPEALARGDAGMAYDAARGQMVLFGGLQFTGGGIVAHGETWVYGARRWEKAADDGPGPRSGFQMVYDSARQKIVLFGGYAETPTGGTTMGDTWEWDGASWTQVATTGPSRRERATMAYDSARGRTVLFGGALYEAAFAFYNDTWEWDGAAWTRVATFGPAARDGAMMAFDSVRGKTVLFGGMGETATFADTWEWDGTSWLQWPVGGPQARYLGSMAFDPRRGRTVVFGGGSRPFAGDLGDTWEWNGAAWARVATAGPAARDGAMMAFDAARQRMFLFGGMVETSATAADRWTWDGNAWRELDTAPTPRAEAAMAFDEARSVAVLFGGAKALLRDLPPNGDTWEWDGEIWIKRAIVGPSPRLGASAIWAGPLGGTVLFGGADAGAATAYGDTWAWDGIRWTRRADDGPPARALAAMAYDNLRNRIVLFGGSAFDGLGRDVYLGDTWEWNGAAWAATGAEGGPSARRGAAMAYDRQRGRAVLFGGASAGPGGVTFHGDTWEWDGAAWSQKALGGPAARTGASMAYDTARNRVVLFGGRAGDDGGDPAFADTWEWDGTAWTQIIGAGPPARSGAAMAYDTARAGFVLFGGEAFGAFGWAGLGDTWMLGAPPGAFTARDAANALRWAGGLAPAPADATRFDVETSGASEGRIDVADAIRIARIAAGLDPQP